jgi:hypothetical protein
MAKVNSFNIVIWAVLVLVLPAISRADNRIFYDGFEHGNTGAWYQTITGSDSQVAVGTYNGVNPHSGAYMCSSYAESGNNWKPDVMERELGEEFKGVTITFWVCWDSSIDYYNESPKLPYTKPAFLLVGSNEQSSYVLFENMADPNDQSDTRVNHLGYCATINGVSTGDVLTSQPELVRYQWYEAKFVINDNGVTGYWNGVEIFHSSMTKAAKLAFGTNYAYYGPAAISGMYVDDVSVEYFYDGFENGMGKWSQGVAGSLPQASVGNYNGVATKSGGYMASSEAVAFNTYKADMMQHSFGTELEDVVITYWMCWDATIDYGTTPATKTAIIIINSDEQNSYAYFSNIADAGSGDTRRRHLAWSTYMNGVNDGDNLTSVDLVRYQWHKVQFVVRSSDQGSGQRKGVTGYFDGVQMFYDPSMTKVSRTEFGTNETTTPAAISGMFIDEVSVEPIRRVFTTDDSLYSTLLSATKPAYSGQNSIYWPFTLMYSELRPFAKQYGLEYVWQDAFEDLGLDGLNPLMNWGSINRGGVTPHGGTHMAGSMIPANSGLQDAMVHDLGSNNTNATVKFYVSWPAEIDYYMDLQAKTKPAWLHINDGAGNWARFSNMDNTNQSDPNDKRTNWLTWRTLIGGIGSGEQMTTVQLQRDRWYELKFVVDNTGVKGYCDGVLMFTKSGMTQVRNIYFGTDWTTTPCPVNAMLVDDVSVSGSPSFSDGFESGMGNWSVLAGGVTQVVVSGPFNGNIVYPWPTLDNESYGYKVCLFPYPDKDKYGYPPTSAPPQNVPTLSGHSCLLDPITKGVMLEDINDGFVRNGTSVYWGVTGGDETAEDALNDGINFFSHFPSYSVVSAINSALSSTGGIPSSNGSGSAQQWIAYRRYIANYMVEWQHSIYDLVKGEDPNVIVVSTDENTQNNAIDFSDLASYADVFAYQVLPAYLNADNAQFGYLTKLFVDLTGKPFWPVLHMENYTNSFTPEEVREIISQAVRNGATGFQLFPRDQLGEYAPNHKNYTISEKYGAPTRWNAMLDLVAEVQDMNKPNFPADANCAILYSQDTMYARSMTGADSYSVGYQTEAAYELLGPYARSWFKFVSDEQIADGLTLWPTYKVIYIPYAEYERAGVQNAIHTFLDNGGTVICGSPKTFLHNDLGADTIASGSVRYDVFGITGITNYVYDPNNSGHITMQTGGLAPYVSNGQILDTSGSYYAKVTTAVGATTLAKFSATNDPVIIEKTHGANGGKTIFFAFNPFASSYLSSPAWRNFFKGLQTYVGQSINKDIWRFKLPSPDTGATSETYECLTNNNMVMNLNNYTFPDNVNTGGSYTYSLEPNCPADTGSGSRAFSAGNLTDRVSVPDSNTAPDETTVQPWLVGWDAGRTAATNIDFTLSASTTYTVKEVRIYYSEQLPAVNIYSSTDGSNWGSSLASSAKTDAGDDVGKNVYSLNSSCKYIRISCGARDAGKKMQLVEVEIWGWKTPVAATILSPANSATGVSIYPTLKWTAGACANSHDVYFGTSNPPAYKTNQTGTKYDNVGQLAPNTLYYWRIDEVGGAGTTTGTVWSFTTAAVPSQASSPNPSNGSGSVSRTPTLSWTAAGTANSHDVYFGTTSANVTAATHSSAEYKGNQLTYPYAPGTLASNTTYYWRIDEVGNGGTTKGATWSFTTIMPTFVAAGAVASNTTAISPALPAGIATGDILLLFLETANQAITIPTPNGGTWTQVASSPQSTGSGTTATRLTAFWSRYNGTQGAPTTSDSGDHQLGRIIAIRGAVDTGNPWDVTAGGVEAASDTSGSIPGATTTVANTLVVAAIATALPDASSTAKFSAWTNANLTSVTERTDNTVTAGDGGGLGVATGVRVATGAYGNTAVTLVNASYKAMMSIAIK